MASRRVHFAGYAGNSCAGWSYDKYRDLRFRKVLSVLSGTSLRHVSAIGAIHRGVGVIYQDLSLFPTLTVAENIAMNQLIAQGKSLVRKRQVHALATRAVEQAEESAALTRARFEKEAVLTADLIGVEGRLLEARLRRTAAAADEHMALVELRRALGLQPLPQS